MSKVLFISATIGNGVSGGATIGKRNLRFFSQISGGDVRLRVIQTCKSNLEHNSCIESIGGYSSRAHTLLSALCLRAGGLTLRSEIELRRILKTDQFDAVFLDSSLLGCAAKICKEIRPQTKVITYFHNVEFIYGMERCRVESYKYCALLPSIYLAEINAVKYSDVVLGISQRDSDLLLKKYGRRFDLVIPVSLIDKFNPERLSQTVNNKLLFVGSDFFANINGLDWLVNNVMSNCGVNAQLDIVGLGLEKYRDRFVGDNINLIGTVSDLDTYYYSAHAVIMPIFAGSGMKVKTAEALQYGRYVIGTPESFTGYNTHALDAFVCANQSEFIQALANLKNLPTNGYSMKNRTVYENEYSDRAVFERFNNFLSKLL